jgi:hypothetical protein
MAAGVPRIAFSASGGRPGTLWVPSHHQQKGMFVGKVAPSPHPFA